VDIDLWQNNFTGKLTSRKLTFGKLTSIKLFSVKQNCPGARITRAVNSTRGGARAPLSNCIE